MLRSKSGLLLAAAAAYGAYRLSKMTPEQKSDLKRRGQDFINKNFNGVGDLLGKKKTGTTTTNGNSF